MAQQSPRRRPPPPKNRQPTTPPSPKIEPKLLHIIRKIVNTSSISPLTSESVLEILLSNHKEYSRRSNLEKLHASIEIGLTHVLSCGTNKRKRDLGEEKYEREAELADQIREKVGSSMLNAGLRAKYTKQNQEEMMNRNASEEKEKQNAETVPNEAPTSPTPTSVKKKKKKRPSSANAALPSTTTNSHTITNSARPKERFSDLGGIDPILSQIRELALYPILHPEVFRHLGVDPPRGVLLRGPPGCGKTHLANAVAGEVGVTFFKISAPEIIGGVSGESEQRVRELFESAANVAPAIIFIDEIDAVAPKRDGRGSSTSSAAPMEKRIVAQLLTCMDGLTPEKTNGAHVMVLGATNRPDALDPALRRAGRFDREICMGVPDEAARESILRSMTKDMRLSGEFDFKVIAKKTPGYVGADVRSLTKEAAVVAMKRIFEELLKEDASLGQLNVGSAAEKESADNTSSLEQESDNCLAKIQPLTPEQLEPLYITMSDFLSAIPKVQPSSKREGFATVPDVTWTSIGALETIREELALSVLEPISHPERFQELGLPLPSGIMLYGPPGCGKTLLAKAIANESGANFISVKGPELLDKYVGESERAVRQVFERARASNPCIVFFDELDSLCPKRGSDSGSGGGGVSERVVNQLLTEMDGLESRKSVFVIAATNRPELIDPAMMRPGRLDKLLYVPLPTPDDRASIFQALAINVTLSPDVDLTSIAKSHRADGFSGADCAALLREAGLAVLRDTALKRTDQPTEKLQITPKHFEYAFDHVMPSVSKKDQRMYDRMREKMARARSRGGVEKGKLNDDEVPKVENDSGSGVEPSS